MLESDAGPASRTWRTTIRWPRAAPPQIPNLSSTQTFDAAEDEIVAFRRTGKRLLPIFLASFAVPRLALELVRD
jgi:hypothetical protein